MAKRDIPEINAGSMADIAFLLLIFFLVTTTLEKEKAMVRMLPKIQDEEIKNPNPTALSTWNLLEIKVDPKGLLFVRDQYMDIDELKDYTLKFYQTNADVMPSAPGTSMQNPGEGKEFLEYQLFDLPYLETELQKTKDTLVYFRAKTVTTDLDNFYIDFFDGQIKYYEDRIKVYNELQQPYVVPVDRMLIRVTNYTKTKYGDYLSIQDQVQGAIDQLRDEKCKEVWKISYEKLKRDLQDKAKPKAQERALKRKKILEILVPGKVVEKSINL